MDILVDQFDSEDDTRRKLEDSQRRSDDWLNTIITTMAGANGVGLLTLATYVPSQSLGPTLTMATLVSSAFFVLGLAMAASAMIGKRAELEFTYYAYREKLQNHHFEKHFVPRLTDAEVEELRAHRNASPGFASLIIDVRDKLTRWLSWSQRWFILGFLVLLGTIIAQTVGNASIKPSKGLMTGKQPSARVEKSTPPTATVSPAGAPAPRASASPSAIRALP